jgi:3-oxoacid CoA-transferase subunit A
LCERGDRCEKQKEEEQRFSFWVHPAGNPFLARKLDKGRLYNAKKVLFSRCKQALRSRDTPGMFLPSLSHIPVALCHAGPRLGTIARSELTPMSMNKVFANADDAVADIQDGATIMVGGFGLCGIPENLIRALVKKGVKNLNTISNNVGVDEFGLGLMLYAGQIRSHKGSYVGENKLLEEMVLTGKIDLELIPQGTFSERIRAGGAGIPAFYTPAGYGTVVAEGKQTREFDGRPYVLEHALKADFALIKAWKGDKWGNLVYRKTARNFNPMMATAAKVTIAEVEHLVEPGEIEPDLVHTPSVYVKRIIQGVNYEKRIERRTLRKA